LKKSRLEAENVDPPPPSRPPLLSARGAAVEAEAASASGRRPSGKVRVADQPQRHGRCQRQPKTDQLSARRFLSTVRVATLIEPALPHRGQYSVAVDSRIVLRQPETELIYRHTWTSRHDAELAIFAWIEGWYNPRTHSSPHWACAAQTYTKQRSTVTPPTSTPPSKLETPN
jgi:hypothetical protein